MNTPVVKCSLEKISHNELVHLLAANPSDYQLANEFVSRYDTVIRHTAAREIYKRKENSHGVLHLEIEDAVSETYMRLFRNEAQALRVFKGCHTNSIFDYLRIITFRTISLYYRALHNENLQPLPENESGDAVSCLADATLAANRHIERQLLEAMMRRSLHLIFRQAYVNRNFIICKLRFLYDYRIDEIARIKGLGLNEHSVSNTSHRVRHFLKQNSMRC